jgi:prophage antirepressor-like protein
MDIVKAFISNEETCNINIKGTYEDPLFQASQIGKLLGIKKIRNTISDFDEDEKIAHTMGASENKLCLYLTEVGLYRLLGMSRKPIARKFQKWVANVIKEIRLNGKYELECQLKEVIDQNIIDCEKHTHDTIITKWNNTNGLYIGRIKYTDDNNMLIKIGSTEHIDRRSKDLKKHFGSFLLLEFFDANNCRSLETAMKNNIILNKYKYEFDVNGTLSTETYIIPKEFYSELVMIIKNKQKDYQGMSEHYIFELEMKKHELELVEKQKQLELIKLQNTQIQNKLPITIIKEVPYEQPIEKQRAITKGYKIQKYTPDGKLLCTYNSIIIVARNEENISESGIRKAVHRKSLYKDHRWLFLDRKLPDDTIQELGETTKIVKQNLELIAMLDINKENIIQVFPDQITAAQSRNLITTTGIYNSIKKDRLCSGHYFCHYSKCSDVMKNNFLSNNKLPERHKRHNSKPVKKLNPITLEIIETFNSYTDAILKYKITLDKLKQVINDNVPYKGFIWSY